MKKLRRFNRLTAIVVLLVLVVQSAPVSARFISVDPKAASYPSVSPYVYCANNPLKYTDPDGELIWLAAAALAAIYIAVSTPDYVQALAREGDRHAPASAGDLRQG